MNEQENDIMEVCINFGLAFDEGFSINHLERVHLDALKAHPRMAAEKVFKSCLASSIWLNLTHEQHESLDDELGAMSKRLTWSPGGTFGLDPQCQRIINDYLLGIAEQIINEYPSAMQGKEAA